MWNKKMAPLFWCKIMNPWVRIWFQAKNLFARTLSIGGSCIIIIHIAFPLMAIILVPSASPPSQAHTRIG